MLEEVIRLTKEIKNIITEIILTIFLLLISLTIFLIEYVNFF